MGNDAVELFVDAHASLGEGALWDEREGCLWWVDLLEGIVHRTDTATGADRTISIGGANGPSPPPSTTASASSTSTPGSSSSSSRWQPAIPRCGRTTARSTEPVASGSA